MNKETFDMLADYKKRKIEDAYYAASNKQISPTDFFNICKDILNPEEYANLFPRNTEIKTEHIDDILQYSGVDLKEENEKIMEYNLSYANDDSEDPEGQLHSLLNVKLFKEYVQRLAKNRKLLVSEDVYSLLFLILKRKLIEFTDKMDEMSKIRVDYSLLNKNLQIKNDLARQLWCLEQIEKSELEKLNLKQNEDKKTKKKNIQEREDLVVKKKLSNTVAMQALGVQQKSWMSGEEVAMNRNITKFKSIYSPYDDKNIEKKVQGRNINMKDFLCVLEKDKRYNKSVFTIQHYFK
ncbi:transcription initiation factor TFIID subunit 4 (TAF4) [Vairimorpha necatrix]|uniref:Transcription initiation factor TFIID subunit 4 n=1 Tax=Vairimorpha necatrix TaxID=6039 RepID=A0AAX4JA19_9MICR